MDGTKRTAFAAALYLLYERGYVRRHPLPKDEVIHVCVALAEEERRRGDGEDVRFRTITDISAWLESLVERPA